MTKVLTVKQVAKMTGRSEDDIRELARSYAIPAWKESNEWRFDKEQTRIWMQANPKQTWTLNLSVEDFEGKTYQQVADEHGVTIAAIEYWVKKLGIRRR